MSKVTATDNKLTNSDSYLSWEGKGPSLGPHPAFLTAAIISLVGKILASAAQAVKGGSPVRHVRRDKIPRKQGRLRFEVRGAKEGERRADGAMAKN